MFDLMMCGDIGGTNSRLKVTFDTPRAFSFVCAADKTFPHEPDETAMAALQLFSVRRGEHASDGQVPGELLHANEYQNEFFQSFEEVCRSFTEEAAKKCSVDYEETPVRVAAFAVAGPVDSNKVAFTNRSDWVVDGCKLAESLKMQSVQLINDFVANGYGLLSLGEEDTYTLQEGQRKPNGVIAMLGAGTGLGECFLTTSSSNPGSYDCFPSEGGHSEFAPRTSLEIEMLQYLKKKFSETHRISYERVCSGRGIANVYEFMRHRFPKKVNPEVDEKVMAAGDQMGGVISQHQSTDTLCQWSMEVFYSSYGAEAGSVALKFLPFGGLYIAGGIAPKNLEAIKAKRKFRGFDIGFMAAFLDKGRVSPMLKQIPVQVVLAEDLGQRGSKYLAFRNLNEILSKEK